uniref:Uncharacterized protein n=1 Tax=Canis lupus dingo TaxID=286419 RepID=A0A8C0LDP4_CANLU
MCGSWLPAGRDRRFFLKVTEGTRSQPEGTTPSWRLGTRPRRRVTSQLGAGDPRGSRPRPRPRGGSRPCLPAPGG